MKAFRVSIPQSFMMLSAIAILAVPGLAQADWGSAVGGLAIGVGLDKLGNDIKEAISNAAANGEILEAQAGGQVYIAIQQAKETYNSELDLTIDKLSGTEQNALNSIASEATDFENKTYKDLSSLNTQVRSSIHDLPFSHSFPQVLDYGPAFLDVNPANGVVHLVLDGDFYDALREGYTPILNVNNKSFPATLRTSAQLGFDIDKSEFAAQPNALTISYATVNIPYATQKLLFFPAIGTSSVSLAVATLPKTPGTIEFDLTTTSPGTARQTKVSPEMSQESAEDDIKCGGEHADLAVHFSYPDSGWAVIPDSTQLQVTWDQGKQGTGQDWWLERTCSTATVACVCMSTEHHGAGTSGKVHFKIVYTEEQSIVNSTTTPQNIDIGWDESRTVTLPAGATWQIQYDRYDGKKQQIAGVYGDAFLKVRQVGNQVTMSTAPFSDLDEDTYTSALQSALKKAPSGIAAK
ncbi:MULTISPECIES: hypothetical protein [Burkholderia]|uniref:Uncharacterized protein n=1 Tax=Burkholderia paludis TaxID=1506587 RepID=A0A6P2SC51_9BURK|nr:MULTISPECIES: hypothetical protein [Burkholderia]CAB3773909.1 hypothetical protein LMG30113_07358 [Burkholderia paludis]VWC47430.1 hypothetical protein BPA30113_07429 [Burkholderia paludis]